MGKSAVAHASNETTIHRSIDDVFAYLAHGENNALWRGRILEVARTSDHDGLNATYRQVISGPNGRRVRHDYRVTVYEPPQLMHFQHSAGLARPNGQLELTAVNPELTAVRFELDWRPTYFRRFLDDMIETWMLSEVAQLAELKRLLELD
jgi:uncharacterized protein YndB with AHSA1/START domain